MNADRENRWPTPREFVDKWEQATDEQRLTRAERMVNDAQMASRCFVMNHEHHIAMLEHRLSATTPPADAGTPPSAPEPSQAATEAHSAQETERLKMGLWDVWVALGHDTDGDTGPGALIAGMGIGGFIGMVLHDAEKWRRESEDDYDADTSRLEARAEAAEAQVARVEALIEKWADREHWFDPSMDTEVHRVADEQWVKAAKQIRAALDGDA